jgi:phage terminase small subunit
MVELMGKQSKDQKLTDKEQAFCREYVISWNGTRAAIDAGYSKKTAAVIAWENLRKPKIQAYIKELMTEKIMAQDEVLARLASHARGTHEHFIRITDDGFVEFDFSDPESQKYLHLIKKIKTKRQRQITAEKKDKASETWEHEWVEVELHDPQKALELIGKHYSLFVDKDKNGNPIQPIVNVYIPKNNRDEDPDADE